MKKIMFNDKYGLTQAVLDGRKTQTRRIVSESLIDDYENWLDDVMCIAVPAGTTFERIEDFLIKRSKLRVGDIVAIAQSYKDLGYKKKQYTRKEDSGYGYLYSELVDEIPMPWPINGFSNKMFVNPELMPHQIRITNVRVERLQDISYEDCIKEGVDLNTRQYGSNGNKYYCVRGLGNCRGVDCYNYDTPRGAYAALIDKVSGKGTWEKNPYVFVYDFELVK